MMLSLYMFVNIVKVKKSIILYQYFGWDSILWLLHLLEARQRFSGGTRPSAQDRFHGYCGAAIDMAFLTCRECNLLHCPLVTAAGGELGGDSG